MFAVCAGGVRVREEESERWMCVFVEWDEDANSTLSYIRLASLRMAHSELAWPVITR